MLSPNLLFLPVLNGHKLISDGVHLPALCPHQTGARDGVLAPSMWHQVSGGLWDLAMVLKDVGCSQGLPVRVALL